MDDVVFALAVYNNALFALGSFSEAGGVPANRIATWSSACPAGYTGAQCETDIDECASAPCENEATCIDEVNGHNCSGGAGFTGVHCETDIDECASAPCENGATCIGGPTGYVCVCQLGFTGMNCETELGECASAPCLNGGHAWTASIGTNARARRASRECTARRRSAGWRSGRRMNGDVDTLAVYDGTLYAGGFFTAAGGGSANRIARWDGTSWSALRTGMNSGVGALAVDDGA